MLEKLKQYSQRVEVSLKAIDTSILEKAYHSIDVSIQNGNTLFIIVNGGSAATESHFATDIAKSITSSGKNGCAFSLCDNSSMLTAISNDYGFEFVFQKQLEIQAKTGDVLLSISASGNSKNLVQAVNYANQNHISTISMTGFDGGILKNISKFSIHVPTAIGDYGVAEDCHSILCHFFSQQLGKK
jgi:D-sedoheptulose 7-phosphate isomerase